MPRAKSKKTNLSPTGKDRITVRLSNNQIQILSELKEKLHTGYSLIIRAILGDFISRNEDSNDSNNTGKDDVCSEEMWKTNYEED